MFRSVAFSLICLGLAGVPAYAADANSTETVEPVAVTAHVDRSSPSVKFEPFAAAAASPSLVTIDWSPKSSRSQVTSRPRALPALYASLAALQAFDAYSTTRGLSQGATEGNPLMQPVVGNQASF